MREAASSERLRRGAKSAIALSALLGLSLWLQESVAAPASGASALVTDRTHHPEGSAAPLERAADGLPIKAAGPDTRVPDEPMHPHPITAEHERIFRENNLVAALSRAVDREDPRTLREVLAQYRAEYPQDAHRLQEGYAIIASCLERLDQTTRARARHFWSTEIRSQTRRYVRRYCLERERAS